MQSSSDNELKELKEQGMDLLMKERQRVRELEACISKLKVLHNGGGGVITIHLAFFFVSCEAYQPLHTQEEIVSLKS